jgi:ATP-dependent RNA helicase SUPV3L1/SUV3
MHGFAPRVRAVLGPTNTGKTHLALERLLAHASGMIGFPLRLLARENYERMVAEKGAARVALITGEEKIVPPGARWFSCTVEAMPLEREVEFLAVDEIQLCADPDRGHVFTDRLLRARGLVETMFLGAETIRPLLRRLVPGIEIETRPRLSTLTHLGAVKLARLPPRSAIVAFSVEQVYAIAEALRRRVGGAAIVMGRLSPRTRNAQVALYQNGEVDYLVATDAIGMGLNLDVDVVAFASLGKFDGRHLRALSAAELAQIAGRAGRGRRDGGFATIETCPPLDPSLAEQIETHRFDPLERLYWRNAELDFSSLEALLASLQAPPRRPGLIRGPEATDELTLALLAEDPEIQARARGRAGVALLWAAASIPDFRKLGDDSHLRLTKRVFLHLANEGRLPEDWIARQVAELDRKEGDIEALMQRLAAIRTWSFITAREAWVREAAHWQAETRRIEDMLSDALHEHLMRRFIDQRTSRLLRRAAGGAAGGRLFAQLRPDDAILVEGEVVGRRRGLGLAAEITLEGEGGERVLRAAQRALREAMPEVVIRFCRAPDSAFTLASGPRLCWEGVPVARLKRGATPLKPRITLEANPFLESAHIAPVLARLQSFLDRDTAAHLAPLFRAVEGARDNPLLRGLLHRLEEALGVLPPEPLAPELRRALSRLGVWAGHYGIFLPALLKPRAMMRRALLWAIFEGRGEPEAGLGTESLGAESWGARVSERAPPGGDANGARRLGWVEAGPVWLRLDAAERLGGVLHRAARQRTPLPLSRLASLAGIPASEIGPLIEGLGFRSRPAEVTGHLEILSRRKPPLRPRAPERPARAAGPHPFAALAEILAATDA